MHTATAIWQTIETAAQTATRETRHIEETMAIGQVVRQGDLYIHRVAADHPRGMPRTERQLAPGTSRGSRHLVEGAVELYEGITVPRGLTHTLIGPRLVATARWLGTHPEHAAISMPPGDYQITYQLDAASQRRVVD